MPTHQTEHFSSVLCKASYFCQDYCDFQTYQKPSRPNKWKFAAICRGRAGTFRCGLFIQFTLHDKQHLAAVKRNWDPLKWAVRGRLSWCSNQSQTLQDIYIPESNLTLVGQTILICVCFYFSLEGDWNRSMLHSNLLLRIHTENRLNLYMYITD